MGQKAKLLEEGFSDWNRKDFRSLVTALEQYGRHDKNNVFRQVAQETGKVEADIERYYTVFWKKGDKQLAEWQKVKDKIEKGEKKIARHSEIRAALDKKVKSYDRAFQQITINYALGGGGGAKGKVWTEDEDGFLVVMMQRHGYGLWERIRQEIRNNHNFKFDWFFKSRNAVELQRRGDVLLRCIEKEHEEAAKKEAAAKAEAKSKARSKSGADKRNRSKGQASIGPGGLPPAKMQRK